MKRIGLFVFLGFAVLAADTGVAMANIVHFTASPNQVAAACGGVGGIPSSGKSGYGCVNLNCDGNGGVCAVSCDKNQHCTGNTPGILPANQGPIRNLPGIPSITVKPGLGTGSNPHGYGVPPIKIPQHPHPSTLAGSFTQSLGSK